MTAITATPKSVRPHVEVAELEHEDGYRYWTQPMPKAEMDVFLAQELKKDEWYLSDLGCAMTCWCGGE